MSKVLTACSDCHTLNNIDIEKAVSKAPVCGSCGKQIKLHGLATEVNTHDLKRIVNKAQLPVIVDFWADWCGPCKMYGPEFEKASLKHSDKAIFLKVDTVKEASISQHFNIRGIPATIVFKNGKEFRRQAGALPSDQIIKLID